MTSRPASPRSRRRPRRRRGRTPARAPRHWRRRPVERESLPMRFMLMFKSDQPVEPGTSPCKQQLPEMAKLMGELKRSGVLVYTDGLMPLDRGARVRMTPGGKATVRDGPFAEAKELVAG